MQQILIIEDDRALNQGLCKALKTDNNSMQVCSGLYASATDRQIVSCENLKDAKEQLLCGMPALILLDINLPDGSGLDFLQSVKRDCPDCPVILLTANDTDGDIVNGLELGADDYITKPFDMEEVLARIESNLRRVQFQNNQTECLQYNNLTLDLEKNTAFLNGIELSLTAKEFGILELLMKYPDKVFSKSNLFQSVWDTEYIAEDNTLNVHISNLRSKLKAICSDTEFIDTVWGIGYRLHKAKD